MVFFRFQIKMLKFCFNIDISLSFTNISNHILMFSEFDYHFNDSVYTFYPFEKELKKIYLTSMVNLGHRENFPIFLKFIF